MNAALAVAGWLDLAASIALAGGLGYAALVALPSPAGRQALSRAIGVLALTFVLEFVLVAIRMHEVSGVRGWTLVVDLAGTRWGHLWALRAGGLAVLAVGLSVARPPWRAMALLAALWLAARSFQGHAGAHGTGPALVDWVHLSAAATWIGTLVQVALDDTAIGPVLAGRLRAIATAGIALLVPAGVYGALLHVPSLDALRSSPYGQVLIAKLALVVVLLALGATNHFRHVPRLQGGDASAAGSLARAVRLEVGIAAVVLLLSALLGVLPMPHELP